MRSTQKIDNIHENKKTVEKKSEGSGDSKGYLFGYF